MTWQRNAIERLAISVRPGGGWGYQTECASSAEPTALACLALASFGPQTPALRLGLEWLARAQGAGGAVAVTPEISAPHWTTSLAALAWIQGRTPSAGGFQANVERAIAWLLRTRGLTFKLNPDVYDHNTLLTGWPWVEGTHSWVEPTGYAILALRSAGLSDHPRVQEAVELILNRAIPGEGWNYGNRRILKNTLRAFPAQTGIALTALAGEPPSAPVESALVYLQSELQRIRSPMSLAWGVMGLTAWNARPTESEKWLAESAERLSHDAPYPALDSLLLLAAAKPCPLLAEEAAATHG